MTDPVVTVDPVASAESAAAVLTRAWPPPALRYTADYLRWQFTFPGDGAIRPVAVAASGQGGFLAFAGATPRRIRLGPETLWAQLVSFVAVDPDRQGQGLASRLYDVLLAQVAAQGAGAVVTFAVDASAGLAALRSAYRRHGWAETDLGPIDALGVVLPGGGKGLREGEGNPSAVAPAGQVLVDNAPDAATLAHYFRDPRGAQWIDLGQAPDGARRGAVITAAERTSARGIEPFGCVTNLFGGPWSDAEAKQLAAEVGRRAPAGATVATIPNPATIGPEVARAARMRTLPGRYRGFLYRLAGAPASAVPAGLSTTVELV